MSDVRPQTPDLLDVVGLSQTSLPPLKDSADLQGSSRTSGGFARGKATGITPNMADFGDIEATTTTTTTISIPSYIYFYFTQVDPSGFTFSSVKPTFKASMSKSSTLEDIVQRLRLQYPGVDGTY